MQKGGNSGGGGGGGGGAGNGKEEAGECTNQIDYMADDGRKGGEKGLLVCEIRSLVFISKKGFMV